MPEDPRPGHQYARPDTHPDFEVEGVGAPPSGDTTSSVDSEGQPVPGGVASKPDEVDPSQSHLRPADNGPKAEDHESDPAREPEDQGGLSEDEQDADQDFDSMTKAELQAHLEENGTNVSSKATKDELVKLAKEE